MEVFPLWTSSCWKDFFLHQVALACLSKISCTYLCGSVCGFSVFFCPSLCVRVLWIPRCLDFCRCRAALTSGREILPLSSFSRLCSYSRAHTFPYKLWNELVCVYKKACCVFLFFSFRWRREEYICQKGFFMVVWAQIHKQSSSHCLQWSLMDTAFQGKATDWATKPPALCSCGLSQPLKEMKFDQ